MSRPPTDASSRATSHDDSRRLVRHAVDGRLVTVLTRLPRSSLYAWWTASVASAGLGAGVAAAVFYGPFATDGWRGWAPATFAAIAVLLAVDVLLVLPLRHRFYGYSFSRDQVLLSRGRLLRRTTVFPLRQVLYVEVRQGPVLRRLDLCTVRLGTIGEAHALGPLPAVRAVELQSLVDERLDRS